MLAQSVRERAPPAFDVRGYTRTELDVTNPAQLADALLACAPEVIINCSAYTKVDDCETHEAEATLINGAGPGLLANIANDLDATLVHVSTDYVFDGSGQRPYRESDATNPQSAYGRSKLAGEQAIRGSGLERYFILRTSWLYGPGGRNFVATMLRLGGEREQLRVVADQRGTPTYTGDLADAMFRLLEAEQGESGSAHPGIEYGIYHVANEGECTWHEFAGAILDAAGNSGLDMKAREVVPIATDEYPVPAERPKYSVLSKDKLAEATGHRMPHWRDGLARYMAVHRGMTQ